MRTIQDIEKTIKSQDRMIDIRREVIKVENAKFDSCITELCQEYEIKIRAKNEIIETLEDIIKEKDKRIDELENKKDKK